MRDQTDGTPVPPVAATVVLLRDGESGPEVLLLERPHDRGSFAGAWVFPGGGVDPEDLVDAAGLDEVQVAERAAVREVQEETGLDLTPGSLMLTACWIPPAGAPKRLRTWFYWAPAPAGTITLAPEEAVDYAWIRPHAALELHAGGTLRLVPPTWVTLNALADHLSVDAALRQASEGGLAHFESRFGQSANGSVVFWSDDVAFLDDAQSEADGPRHRLEIGVLPWVYICALE
ncbi:NUDIX hydrolase [Cryobacterium psychrophilum]|uniref:NUDIX hydrolase n=2 Tax=Cryobacterium psychrophilum TaxID=41988 RepID=A0A4Y8KPC0_9MICO|nr:NUDIX hydrolase [Cryobacterium psychrophilum]